MTRPTAYILSILVPNKSKNDNERIGHEDAIVRRIHAEEKDWTGSWSCFRSTQKKMISST